MAVQCLSPCFFFFFRAEDGIRARNVTGVQTCALPIWKKDTRIVGYENALIYFIMMSNRRKRKAVFIVKIVKGEKGGIVSGNGKGDHRKKSKEKISINLAKGILVF